MAFTNPILAGEELNRTGIRSDNYVPGVSGWRIASDGAAEFDNIGVRHNLSAEAVFINGRDVATQLDALPKGCIAYRSGYPIVSTTSEVQCMVVEADLVHGRYYEVFATNITTDIQTGSDTAEFKIRWEHGSSGSTIPPLTTSSVILAYGLRQSIYQIAVVRYAFWAGDTDRNRYGLFLASLNGSNVRSWAPGGGCAFVVIDHGKAPYDHPGQGVVGSGGTTKTLKEWTVTANSSKTYNGDGTLRTDSYATSMVAGDWANGRGNQRAWCTFSTADLVNYVDDLVGVPASDIVIAEVRLSPFQWGSTAPLPSGYISVGIHNAINSLPNTEPSGGIPNIHRYYAYGNGPVWINLIPGVGTQPAPSTFLDALRDNSLNGFMVGNTFSGVDYRCVCEGVSGWTNPPQLHMKYWK